MKRVTLSVLTSTALAVSLALTAAPAHAGNYYGHHGHNPPGVGTPVTLADGLLSPLSLAVDHHGTSYVAQNFAGVITRVSSHGKQSTVVSAPGQELGALSLSGNSLYYGQTAMDHSSALLKVRSSHRHTRTITDLATYEAKHNPDAKVRYGFRDISAVCAAMVPAEVPAAYTGVVDTHPYASLTVRGRTFIADAGGNDILSIDRHGRVSTVAVLPPAPLKVTAAVAGAQGMPDCVVGHKYYFEPVPTDVAIGRDGWLYVTTLPGEPEGTALGARGAVYKVNPWNGHIQRVAGSLASPTGLTISPTTGTIYVAELFGNRISTINRGHHVAKPLMDLAMPGAIQWTPRALYVTTNVVPPETGAPAGMLVKIPLRSSHRRHGHW